MGPDEEEEDGAVADVRHCVDVDGPEQDVILLTFLDLFILEK